MTLAPVWRSRYVVLDQAVASLSNFLLMVLVGRWLDPSDYGVFALIAASCAGLARTARAPRAVG